MPPLLREFHFNFLKTAYFIAPFSAIACACRESSEDEASAGDRRYTGWQDVAESTGNTKLAILAGLTMIGIYAVQFVAARFSLRDHLTATDMATLRFAGAALVFLPIVWRGGLHGEGIGLAAGTGIGGAGRTALSADHQLGPYLCARCPWRGTLPRLDRVLLVPAVAHFRAQPRASEPSASLPSLSG